MTMLYARLVKKKTLKSDYIQVKVRPEDKASFIALAESRHTDLSEPELVRQLLHREVAQSQQAAV
jgi:hypothetical protein